MITVHPDHKDVWFWLIPFSNGRSSIGVVAEADFYPPSESNDTILKTLVYQDDNLRNVLNNAVFDDTINSIVGYSANVKSLYGKGYALLGNAGEFLDPIFSSGVTIAMKSASLATAVLDRQFKGEIVDWETNMPSHYNAALIPFASSSMPGMTVGFRMQSSTLSSSPM